MADDTRDVEEHLRAASDAILILLTEVQQLERHKRGIRPGDPRFEELARSVRKGATELAEFTQQEEAWARGAPKDDGATATIDESANTPKLTAILDRWREVERALDEAEPGTAESRRLFDEFERLRADYMAAFRAREAKD